MEILYEGSALGLFFSLVLVAIIFCGVVAIIHAVRRPTTTEVLEQISRPALWEYSTTETVERKPVRRRSLPYGAYGTDITRGKARRQQAARE
jgi:hypothetical protein